jgi:hypothetical protein
MHSTLSRWLARLSTSFLILSGLLVYQAYRELHVPGARPNWPRLTLYFLAAGISVGLAARGVRERHRQLDHPHDDHDQHPHP